MRNQRWRQGFELDPEILGTHADTEEDVVVVGPVGLEEPAIATVHRRRYTEEGILDHTRVRRAICASCHAVLHDNNLGAACAVCDRLMCERCSERRCRSCGVSLCQQHSVSTGAEVYCPRHFRFLAVGALVVLAVVGIIFIAAASEVCRALF